MVWFQCEDCGENLKKPKLPRHFSMCSATKLSCIDCGNMFGQDNVQWHNQCITEAEKYGPKGSSNGTASYPKDNSKQELDFDVNVGLSHQYPWICSLCNAKATSQQNLFSHANGRKHRENVEWFYAKQQQQSYQSTVDNKKDTIENYCGNMFGQDSVQWHIQGMTDAEKYGPKGPSNGTPANPKDNPNRLSWFCSLCNAKTTCQQDFFAHVRGKKHRENAIGLDAKQRKQFEQPTVDMVHMNNTKQPPDLDVNVGLSNQYPWFCSLCNSKATSQLSLFSHANGRKHRENVELFNAKGFDAKQRKQYEQPTVDMDNSKQLPDLDVNVGLSNRYPWFCSLCNCKATSQQTLFSHANGRKHRENVEWFNAKNLQQLDQSTVEDASNGDSEEKKVDLRVPACVAQAEKKRKLETFDETWNREGEVEKKSKSKKANKQDHEKKRQSESDSDFEYEKEDMKLLLESYSKQELVNLIYKTAEKGSRLISAILESADRDISQRNILVRGFGWDTTQEYLKAAFEGYGEIEECSVAMDRDTGRSKGYGFVVFRTRKGAREALKNPEKRMYNHNVVCNLAKAHDVVEPVKIDLENRHQQQQTMEMFGQKMAFYGHSRLPGFDGGNQMVPGLPNYCVFGSGQMNQGSVVPSNHVGMTGPYFGDGQRTWYLR